MHVSRAAGAINPSQQVNTFLQNWNATSGHASTLPKYIKTLLKTGKDFNVSIAAVKLDRYIKGNMPMWYHLSSNKALRRLDNTPRSECLRESHNVTTVMDLLKMINKPSKPFSGKTRAHKEHNRCACWACKDDREKGCTKPRTCREAVRKLLSNLTEKWHPEREAPQDNLTLTHRRQEKNAEVLEDGGNFLFDPSITEKRGISGALRVFATPDAIDRPVATRSKRSIIVQQEMTTGYIITIPATKTTPENAAERAKGLVYYGSADPQNTSVIPSTTEEETTNELLEIA
ncbi:hypothetical protein FOMPIDRAFT_1127370, partial [Fomitopsis schrenkii]